MGRLGPYWKGGNDWSEVSFYIHRMDSRGDPGKVSIPRASIPLYGFLYVTQGEVVVEVGEESIPCFAGHFLLIPCSTPFSISHFTNSSGYVGGFSRSFPSDLAMEVLNLSYPHHQSFWFDDAVFLNELFSRMVDWSREGLQGPLHNSFELLLSLLRPSEKAQEKNLSTAFLDLVFAKGENLSIADYAKTLGVSTVTLNRALRANTPHSAKEWIDIRRLDKAKTLLLDPDIPIGEVAERIGLEDQSYFSRFFRKMTGLTPSRFRSEHGKK